MCTDVDYLPQLMVLTEQNLFLRKSSWTPSISSSSSTSTTMKSSGTSWLERKLFSHFKRFFRRQSFSSPSTSADSSRRTSIAVTDEKVFNDDFPIEQEDAETEEDEQPHPLPSVQDDRQEKKEAEQPESTPTVLDPLYDYDQLLQRCSKKQEHHRLEMLEQCQKPVTIPHADLSVSHSRTVLINWKSYTRLFRALNRDPQLFQQYLTQSYSCPTSINQREQLVLNVRTSQSRVDLLLRTFLNEFVTCFECQKAQTHLIRTTDLWRIECQVCGSQRTVTRLRWKHSARTQ